MNTNKLLKLSVIAIIISVTANAGDFTWQAAPSNNVWSMTDQNWNTADAWPAGAGHTASSALPPSKRSAPARPSASARSVSSPTVTASMANL